LQALLFEFSEWDQTLAPAATFSPRTTPLQHVQHSVGKGIFWPRAGQPFGALLGERRQFLVASAGGRQNNVRRRILNMAEAGDARLNPRAVPNAADAATVFFPVLLKAQAEVRLVASYMQEALTEYLHNSSKFNWRGGFLSTPPHISGVQMETEDHFNQVLFVLLASNLLSVEAQHVVRAVMYIKSTLSTKLAKKFNELWVIEEQRDQVVHGYQLLLTVQAFLTAYVSQTVKDNQLKALAGLHWMTTVAATKAALEQGCGKQMPSLGIIFPSEFAICS